MQYPSSSSLLSFLSLLQVHEKALSDVEIRLQKELKDLGLLLANSAMSAAADHKKNSAPEVEKDDEIVAEIKKLQLELKELVKLTFMFFLIENSHNPLVSFQL